MRSRSCAGPSWAAAAAFRPHHCRTLPRPLITAPTCPPHCPSSASLPRSASFCPVQATADHIRSALAQSGKIMRPVGHARNLRHFNRGFRLGRQEDAHEYLRRGVMWCIIEQSR